MAKDLKQFIYNADELADMLDQEERRKQFEQNKNKPKLNLEDFIITKAKDRNQYDVIDPDTNKAIGHFPYYQSRIRDKDLIGLNQIQLPDYITTDYPFIEPEYQGRGLGKQMYKFLERETGKTILPDTSLSESSLPLHKSSGIGKDFGSSNYKDKIIQSIKKQLGPESTELAEQLYEGLKNKIQKQGLTGFKSVAPILKTGGAVGLPLVAAASNYAEAKEEGMPTPLAAAYAAAEELNPTPVSGIDFYKGMEKSAQGRKQNIESVYMPEEMKMAQEALENYRNSPAAKDRAFARIKNILKK